MWCSAYAADRMSVLFRIQTLLPLLLLLLLITMRLMELWPRDPGWMMTAVMLIHHCPGLTASPLTDSLTAKLFYRLRDRQTDTCLVGVYTHLIVVMMMRLMELQAVLPFER